jgi:hypothetical protein
MTLTLEYEKTFNNIFTFTNISGEKKRGKRLSGRSRFGVMPLDEIHNII